jgi:hypothetical protein
MHQTVRLVGKVDFVFVVSNAEEGNLGELHLSKGGVDWWPSGARTYFHRCSWEGLRDFLEKRPVKSAT